MREVSRSAIPTGPAHGDTVPSDLEHLPVALALMRIGLDPQARQPEDGGRAMGRCSLSLARANARPPSEARVDGDWMIHPTPAERRGRRA